MNTSSGGQPRTSPSDRGDRARCRGRGSSSVAAHARQPRLQRGRRCRSAVASRCAILPSSVRMPVATHLRDAGPGGDRRAHEHAVVTLGQRRVRRRGRRRLLDRRALAGQGGLVGRQRVRFDEARVGGDDVARFEHQQVAGDHGRGGDPTRWPSRITGARGAVSDRSASSAFSARCSWKKPTSALSTTIVAIATASATSPRNPDTPRRRAAAR